MNRFAAQVGAALALMALTAPLGSAGAVVASAGETYNYRAEMIDGVRVRTGWVSDAAVKADPSLPAKLGLAAPPASSVGARPQTSGVV